MARFFKIGLIVTGKGEERFLPDMLRALTSTGTCHFRVLRWIGQRGDIGSSRRLKMVGRGQLIPDRDQEIGLFARAHLQYDGDALVMVVDDLEHARRPQKREVFRRYRLALDVTCGPHYSRASVHFLANMLEAYYFAHASVIADVCGEHGLAGAPVEDCDGDVEEIRHPKEQLKKLVPGFHEIRHGARIVSRLDLERVLARPDTCGSLRALVGWCIKKIGQPRGERFCLNSGVYDIVTGPQIGDDYRSSWTGLAHPSAR